MAHVSKTQSFPLMRFSKFPDSDIINFSQNPLKILWMLAFLCTCFWMYGYMWAEFLLGGRTLFFFFSTSHRTTLLSPPLIYPYLPSHAHFPAFHLIHTTPDSVPDHLSAGQNLPKKTLILRGRTNVSKINSPLSPRTRLHSLLSLPFVLHDHLFILSSLFILSISEPEPSMRGRPMTCIKQNKTLWHDRI